MLLELHVRNLALIERADVEFGEGLNIMTGETGAGKSIIIGSVNLALGQKVPKDIIRSGADYAYVELVFQVEGGLADRLREGGVAVEEDGLLVITRKIMPGRSIGKINDETATAAKLREVTALLIDIHGQQEHQSLLHKAKHLEILDAYARAQTLGLKGEVSRVYHEYRELEEKRKEDSQDGESRRREMDFLQFEIEEIENAALKKGEEEALTEQYRRYMNRRRIMESLSAAYGALDTDGVGMALRQVSEAAEYDSRLAEIQSQLYDAEAILNDIRRTVGDYLETMSYDERELVQMEERLDLIHGLQAKYGATFEKIQEKLEEKRSRLSHLEHFDEYRRKLEADYHKKEAELEGLCKKLSEVRRTAAVSLIGRIREGLEDLNFLDVKFLMEFRKLEHFTANGYDEAEFLISTNPGEPPRPLGNVASGGELSRIMLAVKAALADSDAVATLIFDEIDAGISGRTAQKVSEKLSIISQSHQVVCITHLPQIAAMADCHFEIAKSTEDGKTSTKIHRLDEDEMEKELARLLGGAVITDAVRQNAREMKSLAETMKKAVKEKLAEK